MRIDNCPTCKLPTAMCACGDSDWVNDHFNAISFGGWRPKELFRRRSPEVEADEYERTVDFAKAFLYRPLQIPRGQNFTSTSDR